MSLADLPDMVKKLCRGCEDHLRRRFTLRSSTSSAWLTLSLSLSVPHGGRAVLQDELLRLDAGGEAPSWDRPGGDDTWRCVSLVAPNLYRPTEDVRKDDGVTSG